jgi:hypothetical protein
VGKYIIRRLLQMIPVIIGSPSHLRLGLHG